MTGREGILAQGRRKDALTPEQMLAEANKVTGSRDCVDWLAKWSKARLAEQRKAPVDVNGQALDEKTSLLVASLISSSLDSDNSATQQRAQVLLQTILQPTSSQKNVEDGAEHFVPSSSFQTVLLQPAIAHPELKKSLLVLEASLDVFGTRILGPKERLREILCSLTAGLATVDGGPRRKAAVIASIIKASFPTQLNASHKDIGWQDVLRDALCGTSELSRIHIREFVLPSLYDHEPAIFKMLCTELLHNQTSSNRMDALRGLLALLKPARRLGLCRVDDNAHSSDEILLSSKGSTTTSHALTVIPTALVELCILSADDEVSTGALTLLSQSKTSSSPFEAVELRLLLRYFTGNIAATDAGTRSRVTAMFSSVLTRLRMSTYASARTLAKLDSNGPGKVVGDRYRLQNDLVQAQDFLIGIFRLCCQNLWPGASYPSMLSSLNYLDLLLSSQLDSRFGREDDSHGASKESTAEASKALHKSMKVNPQTWPFQLQLIDDKLVNTLLSCFSSTFDDIRTLARKILFRFPLPLEGISADGKAELLEPAKRLLLSARASQTGTGTALLQTYGHFCSSRKGEVSLTSSPQSSLVHSLLDFANEQVNFAEEFGVARAAEQRPVHGCLWALQQVIAEDSLSWSRRGQEDVEQISERTRHLVDKIWAIVQPILSSQEAATAADSEAGPNEEPQAAQPDLELARAISLAGGEGSSSAEVASAGPYRHQVLLSYGWRSMKEASTLLRVLISVLLNSASQALPSSVVEQIGGQLLEWMTKIRHRGAFSVIYPELSTVAAALIASGRNDLVDLPRQWLDHLMSDICSRDTSFSTTRRSAGLSYAVLGLLQAFQAHPKSSPDIARTMALRLAQEADRLQSESQSGDDARQVHLFNIARILVLDGRVGPQLVPIIGQLLRLAVSRFQSNSWDLSNVAMLLFSATINRAFASRQQQNKDETGRKAAFDKFFTDHVGLAEFLIDELLRLQADQSGSGTASGSLFALMAFIARLQATAGDGDGSIRKRFRLALTQVSQSHALLRDIAARAFASTVTVDEATAYSIEALSDVDPADLKHSHGLLLRVQFLLILALQDAHSTGTKSDAEALVSKLQEASGKFLNLHDSIPEMVATALLDVLRTASLILRKGQITTDDADLRKLCRLVLDGKISTGRSRSENGSRCSELLAHASFALLDLEGGSSGQVLDLLDHSGAPVREATLSYIQSNPQLLQRDDAAAIEVRLDRSARDARLPISERCTAISVLIRSQSRALGQDRSDEVAKRISDSLWEAWDTPCVPLREHLIQYASRLLVSWGSKLETEGSNPASDFVDCIRLLTENIRRAADEEESVESRLAAVSCLRILAPLIFDKTFVDWSNHEEGLAVDVLHLQLAAVRMVEDDDEDIRHEAARSLAEGLDKNDAEGTKGQSAIVAMIKSLNSYGGSPQTAKEDAWAWLQHLYSGLDCPGSMNLRWRLHLWTQILPSQEQYANMHKLAFEARTALFAVDEANQYRDKTHDSLLAARILTKSSASQQPIQIDLQDLAQSLLNFAKASQQVQNRPELGDVAVRYVLGLRLVLAAYVAQASGHVRSKDMEASVHAINDQLALTYTLDTVRSPTFGR
ncbi:hypothetical protein CF326_g1433 [Tilletia indica]|nr:hypothetical protein CF326_g1433 [Tilletia indica]